MCGSIFSCFKHNGLGVVLNFSTPKGIINVFLVFLILFVNRKFNGRKEDFSNLMSYLTICLLKASYHYNQTWNYFSSK